MLYHNVRVAGYYLRCIDAAVVGCASIVTWRLGLAHWSSHANGSDWHSAAAFSLGAAIAFTVLGARIRAYHARRTEDVARELASLCELVFYAVAVSCLVTGVLIPAPAAYYAASWATATLSVVVCRMVMRVAIRRSRARGEDYRAWMIVGYNSRTVNLVRTIQANPHFGIRILDIVDLPARQGSNPAIPANSPGSVPCRIAEDVQSLRAIIGSQVVDEVIVTLPVRTFYDEIQRILDFCCEAGIPVRLRPESFERAGYRTEVTHIGEMALVTHFTGPSNQAHLLVKRAMDLVGAATGLIAGSPLFLLIAIAVKCSGKGPVFFRQRRVGLHGRQFSLIKFRSMVPNASNLREQLEPLNEIDSVAFKIRNDPRITAVGRVLRRFHLDELPQLWNVLVGDMSLVGPRPLPPGEALGNEWWQRRRLSMPPGLTCFWQVQGDHGTPFREWMQMDIAYIDRWSIWLDVQLIWSTFPALVRGKGW